MQRFSTFTFLVPLALLGSSSFFTGPSGSAAEDEPVRRELLVQVVDPPGAPGRHLTLVRYTIAPGAQLTPHVHPGVQVASIISGTLSYQVVSGTAIVQRCMGPDGTAAATEELEGPSATNLGPGDAVIEKGDMVHYGANETDQPVVILATLLTEGQDLAVSIDP